MSFARTFDSAQSLATLALLPGSVVVRLTPAQAPLGVGSGTVAIVGEVANDQAGDSTKTVAEIIREITSSEQVVNDYGGLSDYIGLASNGWEGNLAKALALGGLRFARLAICSPDLSAGQVTFTRPNPGVATVTPGNQALWRFDPGDTIVLAVDGGGDETATFDAARASITSTAININDIENEYLDIAIDDGATQRITFTATEVDMATLLAKMNADLEGAHVEEVTGKIKIESDVYGTDSKVEIIASGGGGGTVLTELGLTLTNASGTGDVANIRAVTGAEFKVVVEADRTAVVNATTGAISTSTSGAGGSIKIQTTGDLDDAAKMNFSTTLVTGGTDSADATYIPAGTRVTDGTSVYLTLENLSFPAGSSGTALSQSVRARPASDSTTFIGEGQCTTITDTPDDTTFTCTNASRLTPPDFDTQYAAAIAVCQGDTGIAGEVDYIIARRHTAAVHTALRSFATTKASGKRPAVAFLSPPIGTPNASAIASNSVGVGTSRSRYWGYAYPGFQARLADDPATLVDMPADIAAAHMASIMLPEQNIGENRDAMIYVLGLESGLDVTPSAAQYSAWLNDYGILPLQVVNGKAEFFSDPTTELTAPNDELNHVRMVNYLTVNLHDIGARWAKKLRKHKNKEGLRSELEAFFDGLKSENAAELQRIEDYSVDDESGNTTSTIAAGLHVLKIPVQTLGLMNTIVFMLEAGKTVKVTAQAVAAQGL